MKEIYVIYGIYTVEFDTSGALVNVYDRQGDPLSDAEYESLLDDPDFQEWLINETI